MGPFGGRKARELERQNGNGEDDLRFLLQASTEQVKELKEAVLETQKHLLELKAEVKSLKSSSGDTALDVFGEGPSPSPGKIRGGMKALLATFFFGLFLVGLTGAITAAIVIAEKEVEVGNDGILRVTGKNTAVSTKIHGLSVNSMNSHELLDEEGSVLRTGVAYDFGSESKLKITSALSDRFFFHLKSIQVPVTAKKDNSTVAGYSQLQVNGHFRGTVSLDDGSKNTSSGSVVVLFTDQGFVYIDSSGVGATDLQTLDQSVDLLHTEHAKNVAAASASTDSFFKATSNIGYGYALESYGGKKMREEVSYSDSVSNDAEYLKSKAEDMTKYIVPTDSSTVKEKTEDKVEIVDILAQETLYHKSPIQVLPLD